MLQGVRILRAMSTPTPDQPQRPGLIPQDTFPVRLAIVRALMGWNYDQAERATGINSETWRLWEKGKRKCSDIETVSVQIAAVTPYDRRWIQAGGPLADPQSPTARRGPQPTVGLIRLNIAAPGREPVKTTPRRAALRAVPSL